MRRVTSGICGVSAEAADRQVALDAVETERFVGVVGTRCRARSAHGSQPRLTGRHRRHHGLSRLLGGTPGSVAAGSDALVTQEHQTLVAQPRRCAFSADSRGNGRFCSSFKVVFFYAAVLSTLLTQDWDMSGVAIPVHHRLQTSVPRQGSGYSGDCRVLDAGCSTATGTDDLSGAVAAASAILTARCRQVSNTRGSGVCADEAVWTAAGGSRRRGGSSCTNRGRADHPGVRLASNARPIGIRPRRSNSSRAGVLGIGWSGAGDRQRIRARLLRGRFTAEHWGAVLGEIRSALETNGMRAGQEHCIDVQQAAPRTTQFLFHTRLELHHYSATSADYSCVYFERRFNRSVFCILMNDSRFQYKRLRTPGTIHVCHVRLKFHCCFFS